jgi:3D (Asp-Asp-Asp) domain-containing protein
VKSAIAVFFLLLLFLSSLITIFILRVVNYEAGIEIATSNERSVELGVTAYYKPLPKQKKFVTGSYRREIRLNGSGTTATGKPVRIGHAAADPRVFPFGSILEVPGHGRVIIEDVGSRIKGERLDIFVGVGDVGREKAMDWGKKTLLVTVLDRAESRNGE